MNLQYIEYVLTTPSTFKKSNLQLFICVCVCVVGETVVSKGNLSLCVYLLYHNSRPGSFNVSEVTMSSDSFGVMVGSGRR